MCLYICTVPSGYVIVPGFMARVYGCDLGTVNSISSHSSSRNSIFILLDGYGFEEYNEGSRTENENHESRTATNRSGGSTMTHPLLKINEGDKIIKVYYMEGLLIGLDLEREGSEYIYLIRSTSTTNSLANYIQNPCQSQMYVVSAYISTTAVPIKNYKENPDKYKPT